MKVVIMSAGKGVRMLPLTKNTNKSLIEINGKPFLSYLMNNLREAGLNNIALIVGYKKEKVKEYLEKNYIKAELIEQKEYLGTGDAVKYAKGFVGQDNFILIGGDTLISSNDLREIAKEDGFNYVSEYKTETPEKFGILVCSGDSLIKIIEKPKKYVSNLASIGLYKFSPEIFKALEQTQLSPRGEYELIGAINILAKQGKIKVVKLKDYWVDLGCKEDIPKVETFLKHI